MKVLLVKPVVPKNFVLNCIPPLGLGYLATAIREAGINQVGILDCVKENLSYENFEKRIKRFKPDVVGFSVFSHDLISLEKSLQITKRINSKIITIAGGPHPSGLPVETLQEFKQLDYIFCGEAEIGLPQLINYFPKKITGNALSSIPGLAWRKKNGQIKVNPQAYLEDLDSIGYVAWDLLRPQEYPDAPQGVIFRNLPVAPIMATRGCPFNCTFCAGWTISGKKIRKRNIDNLIGEIDLLYHKYGVREIHFLDDNFTFFRDYIEEFCHKLMQKEYKISWCCPNGVRLDTLDQKILKLMQEAGCYYVSVGIEAGSDRILRLMRKGTKVSKIKKMMQEVHKARMPINGFFILGYPGETRKEILHTISFAKSLDLSRAAFYNYLPLPRTEAYQRLISSGELKKEDIDWSRIFQADVPYESSTLSHGELKYLQKKAHWEFYLRPIIIWRLLKEIRSYQQAVYIFRRAKAYMFN